MDLSLTHTARRKVGSPLAGAASTPLPGGYSGHQSRHHQDGGKYGCIATLMIVIFVVWITRPAKIHTHNETPVVVELNAPVLSNAVGVEPGVVQVAPSVGSDIELLADEPPLLAGNTQTPDTPMHQQENEQPKAADGGGAVASSLNAVGGNPPSVGDPIGLNSIGAGAGAAESDSEESPKVHASGVVAAAEYPPVRNSSRFESEPASDASIDAHPPAHGVGGGGDQPHTQQPTQPSNTQPTEQKLHASAPSPTIILDTPTPTPTPTPVAVESTPRRRRRVTQPDPAADGLPDIPPPHPSPFKTTSAHATETKQSDPLPTHTDENAHPESHHGSAADTTVEWASSDYAHEVSRSAGSVPPASASSRSRQPRPDEEYAAASDAIRRTRLHAQAAQAKAEEDEENAKREWKQQQKAQAEAKAQAKAHAQAQAQAQARARDQARLNNKPASSSPAPTKRSPPAKQNTRPIPVNSPAPVASNAKGSTSRRSSASVGARGDSGRSMQQRMSDQSAAEEPAQSQASLFDAPSESEEEAADEEAGDSSEIVDFAGVDQLLRDLEAESEEVNPNRARARRTNTKVTKTTRRKSKAKKKSPARKKANSGVSSGPSTRRRRDSSVSVPPDHMPASSMQKRSSWGRDKRQERLRQARPHKRQTDTNEEDEEESHEL